MGMEKDRMMTEQKLRTLCLTLMMALAAVALGACDDGAEGDPAQNTPANTDMSGDALGGDVTTPPTTTNGEPNTPADCAFDETKMGTGLDMQIENFPLKTWDNQTLWFHDHCGGGNKVVWIFLTTGWCGACESYANTAQAVYEEYHDAGLEILWIVGENQNKEVPSWDYMEDYFNAKTVTFPVIRDPKFIQTYTYVDRSEPSLPHQFILDATTMELVHKEGGTSDVSKQMVIDMVLAE